MKDIDLIDVKYVTKVSARLGVLEHTYPLCTRERKNMFVAFVTKGLVWLVILEHTYKLVPSGYN